MTTGSWPRTSDAHVLFSRLELGCYLCRFSSLCLGSQRQVSFYIPRHAALTHCSVNSTWLTLDFGVGCAQSILVSSRALHIFFACFGTFDFRSFSPQTKVVSLVESPLIFACLQPERIFAKGTSRGSRPLRYSAWTFLRASSFWQNVLSMTSKFATDYDYGFALGPTGQEAIAERRFSDIPHNLSHDSRACVLHASMSVKLLSLQAAVALARQYAKQVGRAQYKGCAGLLNSFSTSIESDNIITRTLVARGKCQPSTRPGSLDANTKIDLNNIAYVKSAKPLSNSGAH